MNHSEFYIGWQPKAPDGFAKHIRKVVVCIAVSVIVISVLLGLLQKKFSTSSFEFGKLTEIKGVFRQQPVPSVRVITGTDAFGHSSFITLPLVGYGKHGAGGVIASLEKKNNVRLDGKLVTLRGSLIYSDGKALLQIDEHEDPLVKTESITDTVAWKPRITEWGTVQLTGEILDPKCYFGVMKPGHGKPHRDCAIRCIAGGINPVFCTKNENGELDYFLLLDQNGESLNKYIQDNVAEPVTLTARAVRYDDWTVLYVDKQSIHRTGGLSWFKSGDISCGKPVK